MQASCLEVPCIVSDINGCNEIIQDGQNGLIVPVKDSDQLYQAMSSLILNEKQRNRFAKEARDKIVRDYDQQFVWKELHSEYNELLAWRTPAKPTFFAAIVKPFVDKVVAAVALLIASPVILVCMLFLYRANHGTVWFTQRRPGKYGQIFKVIKFKTMNDARNEKGELLPDEYRLHTVGKFIRKTSLDELPQLINVLKGDMSIVGPRPLLEEYLPLYDAQQRKRHLVKPGITGWAQVNGRNTITWEQKFAYDLWYVEHQSFWLDLKIIFMTVLKVFKAEGINSATSATMERFSGTRHEG
jgi:lipopolysaccharide/colanic/teichoic acid biosynthesis glycosyltransferase